MKNIQLNFEIGNPDFDTLTDELMVALKTATLRNNSTLVLRVYDRFVRIPTRIMKMVDIIYCIDISGSVEYIKQNPGHSLDY